jgi:hypothetical protein
MKGAQGAGAEHADHPATLKSAISLRATSASLAIPAAISFALFAQLFLVEAG